MKSKKPSGRCNRAVKRRSKGAFIDIDDGPSEGEGLARWQRIDEIDAQLALHGDLESEMKNLKSQIREVEKQKDTLIASARAKITVAEEKKLILARFKRLLIE